MDIVKKGALPCGRRAFFGGSNKAILMWLLAYNLVKFLSGRLHRRGVAKSPSGRLCHADGTAMDTPSVAWPWLLRTSVSTNP